MLNIGFIGIGNCGNQIGAIAFDEKKIPTFGINASEKDLESITSEFPVYVLGDKQGCGKDRKIAMKFVKKYAPELIKNEEFNSFLNDIDLVFVGGSTGGGTGSGMLSVVAEIIAKVFKKKVIVVAVLPTLEDSIGAQSNTLELLKEIRDSELPYLLYDNSKYSELPVNEMMDKINHEVANAMAIIRGDYSYPSPYGMIDDMDMLKIVSMKGMLNIIDVPFNAKSLDNKSLEVLALDTLYNNGTCELDRDKIVKTMGVIINIEKDLVSRYNKDYTELKSVIGEPITVFEHYYEITEKGIENRLCILLSGLSLPDDRIEGISKRIKDAEEALTRKKDTDSLANASESISFLSDIIGGETTEDDDDKPGMNLDDILGKY